MPSLRTVIARRLLPRLVGGTLPVRVARFVHAAMRADPELSAAYDALRRIEGADKLSEAPLSSGQLDFLEALIVDAASKAPADVEERASHRRFSLLGAPALAAAALVVFVVLPRATGERDGADRIHVGDLNARGAKLAQAPLGVKVTCMSADGAHVIGTATA